MTARAFPVFYGGDYADNTLSATNKPVEIVAVLPAAAHYDYSPFGEQLIASGPLAATFTHRFSTKPWCPVTGFCEYQMRKYLPEIGRWMSRDPITNVQPYGNGSMAKDATNGSYYSFISNNPISSIDLFGLVKKFPRDVDAQKDFISQWTTNNISDLDYSYALGHLHCDESPVFVRASMRSRFSNLIIGDSDLIDCYSKLGVSFDCVPCGKGR